jgi:hypothetical protein
VACRAKLRGSSPGFALRATPGSLRSAIA